MRRTNRKCRLWWPTHLSSLNQLNSLHSYAFLFGWFISSSEASFDIIVAFACDESSLLSMKTHMNLENVKKMNTASWVDVQISQSGLMRIQYPSLL
ncbi:hypothetical protein HAX54_006605 [Datura stramonium]|uniref:Uncharacterized protein n=1 Tax=Datura stramonium TaxID=4076 RepID=A0ABS8WY40_DATST|nr:hypothetical protein [Datura stramonium]